ncbi:MAG: putative ornithine cyclodeaminase, mu-crystallin [Chloroflexi bacterium]|nr:putative ornithine cyclodeaminase, mu-crystallin [Chloroflexota bacterium]
MVLIVRPKELVDLIDISEAIDAIEDGYRAWGRDHAINAPRQVIHKRVRLAAHQALVPSQGVVGIFAHIHDDDAASLVFDSESGTLEAIVIGRIACGPPISGAVDLRTPATSAVATRALARSDARTVGIIGSGRQARGHLAAIAAVRDVRLARVFSPTIEHRDSFAEQMAAAFDLEVTAVSSAREAVEGMDIVLVMTATAEPVLLGDWLSPGQHVTSVMGGNTPLDAKGKPTRAPRRDFDNAVIRRSDVLVINAREQARQDWQGDIMEPIQDGVLTWERVFELGELLDGRAPTRTKADQITVYKNNGGQGVADMALAGLAVARARERGIGVEI